METAHSLSSLILFLVLGLAKPSIGQVRLESGGSVPVFVVTAPKHARYDTPTTFSVSASSVGVPATIRLFLRPENSSDVVLNETTLTFTENGVKTWSVVLDSHRMSQQPQQAFQIVAKHQTASNSLDVSMDQNSGYIMVQTDKTIYTPRQTVMYRVIALDNDQKFAHWPVTVDIMNPDLIILDRQHHRAIDAFTGRNFSLPKDAAEGTYAIRAYFAGSKVATQREVKFDVKEYVLPTFKVEVSAQEKVIVSSTSWLRVHVKAVYSYGQPVQGTIQLRLGMLRSTSIALFNVSYSARLNSSGQHTFTLPVTDLRNHSAWFPDGSRMYLEANVTESGTGEVGTGAAMDSFFANPYYQIGISQSKKYFKPGFPYTMVVDVHAANGDPASGISIFTIVEIRDGDMRPLPGEFSTTFELDAHGRVSHKIETPPQAHAIKIQIYTLDPRTPDWSQKDFDCVKFSSPTNTYLHLEQAAENNITLAYTGLPSAAPPQLITVLVLSKGRLIYNTSVPRNRRGISTLILPQEVLTAAAPKARLLAYFYVDADYRTETVADSLYLDTADVCKEELLLRHPSQSLGLIPPFLPKQQTNIIVRGGRRMHVGLVAVDKAVFFLKDKMSLSRQQMFNILGDSDDGAGMGDGQNTDKIFEFSGLKYMVVSNSREDVNIGSSIEGFDIDRLNHIPGRNRCRFCVDVATSSEDSIPLDRVRKYFPESWLFHEITLPEEGMTSETIAMPDSITTWSLMAVGVGAAGGVCVSPALELTVFQPFFVNVRLPYKAVRLEEVRINIGIYNHKDFPISVTVNVYGGVGVCFTEGVGGRQDFSYSAHVPARATYSESIRMIPLVTGSVEITVDVMSTNRLERDVVTRTLHVVAEGRKVQKVITFPLDPSGLNSPSSNRLQETHTATVHNQILGESNKQLTKIELYMPEEVVQGSERCEISACGDLMGDIISTAVMEGDSLFDSAVLDAEEAVGNLAPPLHALRYLNASGIMTSEVASKGRAYVTLGVSRLLRYRHANGSFSLSASGQPATWLTALVLKTLCHAEEVTFIDHDQLLDAGFAWLLGQVRDNGTLAELDRRLAQPSLEYDVMLSADALIALQECAESRRYREGDTELMNRLVELLKVRVETIGSALVMAKTAYALALLDPTAPEAVRAVQRLDSFKRVTVGGLMYWSVRNESEPPSRPFWYHSGTRASTIEATAYSLLVFARQQRDPLPADLARFYDYEVDMPVPSTASTPQVNLDAIAGWLIQKRNSRGAFIGALDSAVATQALSKYSMTKQRLQEVNLHCNVTTSPSINYTHSFDFSHLDAIRTKTLPDVPVGRQLQVETTGTGLGQMQVRVEYNIPVKANSQCRYNITITRRAVSYNWLVPQDNPVCQYCNMDCNNNNDDTISSSEGDSRLQGEAQNRGRRDSGDRRFRRQSITASRLSICLQVCLRSTHHGGAGRTILNIEMLSGFQPYAADLQRLIDRNESLQLSGLVWVPETWSVEMIFNQVPGSKPRCVSFRALERENVGRRNPAIVKVRSHEDQEATCVQSYDPVTSDVNLAVFCADPSTSTLGQCRCISGLCGKCPPPSMSISLPDVRDLVCRSQFVYKIHQNSFNISDDWVDMHFNLLSTLKSNSEPVESQLHMVTPKSCPCPYAASFGSDHPLYFFGSSVDVFVNRQNQQRKTYVIDETTSFISASRNSIQDWINMATQGSMCIN